MIKMLVSDCTCTKFWPKQLQNVTTCFRAIQVGLVVIFLALHLCGPWFDSGFGLGPYIHNVDWVFSRQLDCDGFSHTHLILRLFSSSHLYFTTCIFSPTGYSWRFHDQKDVIIKVAQILGPISVFVFWVVCLWSHTTVVGFKTGILWLPFIHLVSI